MKLKDILQGIEPLSPEKLKAAHDHSLALAIPSLALGRIHELGERLCAIQGTSTPVVDQKAFLVMAGDHGVATEGVSAFPQEVTGEMVKNFLAGGASINALASDAGAEVWVVDMGIIPDLSAQPGSSGQRFIIRKIARGTNNLAQGPAMDRSQAKQSLLTGFELASQVFADGVDLLGVGDMGIANTTASTAIAAVLTGKPLEEMVGRGTGLDDPALAHKRGVIARALKLNRPNPADGLDVLAKVGGFEIGGIAGCVLAGAYHQKPVVIDGLISTAGALIAHALCPPAAGYIFAGHRSQEPAHQAMLARLGTEPILDLGMRLGEGTGAALAMNILSGAAAVMRQVLTFEQAGVNQG